MRRAVMMKRELLRPHEVAALCAGVGHHHQQQQQQREEKGGVELDAAGAVAGSSRYERGQKLAEGMVVTVEPGM